jgi:CRP/FNR family cyclic AMP-dependent transcriptional regulator
MAELNIIEKVIALEAVELLKNLTPDQISRIASIANEEKLLPGRAVLEPGRPLDSLYVIVDGAVEITRNGQTLHVARQYEVLGSWALFDEDPIPVTATTVEDTRVLRISRDDFFDLLSDNMEIAASIFSTLVKRFRKLVEQSG